MPSLRRPQPLTILQPPQFLKKIYAQVAVASDHYLAGCCLVLDCRNAVSETTLSKRTNTNHPALPQVFKPILIRRVRAVHQRHEAQVQDLMSICGVNDTSHGGFAVSRLAISNFLRLFLDVHMKRPLRVVRVLDQLA